MSEGENTKRETEETLFRNEGQIHVFLDLVALQLSFFDIRVGHNYTNAKHKIFETLPFILFFFTVRHRAGSSTHKEKNKDTSNDIDLRGSDIGGEQLREARRAEAMCQCGC